MTAQVIVAAPAQEQVRTVDDWWVANRPAARTLFRDELEAALVLLAAAPDAGPRFLRAGRKGIRRLLLRRSRFHVYYVHDRRRAHVLVVAVWGSTRGHGPPLG